MKHRGLGGPICVPWNPIALMMTTTRTRLARRDRLRKRLSAKAEAKNNAGPAVGDAAADAAGALGEVASGLLAK
jgi:hypothetical protein